jgi:hypothetical protein
MSLPIAQLGMGMYQQLANYHPYFLSMCTVDCACKGSTNRNMARQVKVRGGSIDQSWQKKLEQHA